MLKKIKILFVLFCLAVAYGNQAYSEDTEPVYTQLRPVDVGTFNEYRYKITDAFFVLRNKYDVNGTIDVTAASAILELAKKGYNYLPDSLTNKNYYNYLKTSLERGIKFPNNTSNYSAIVSAIENYLDKTNIDAIKGRVEAFPSTGNAPLTVTFRGTNIIDPTGTKIPSYNYTWWIYENGQRKILGDNITLTHVFTDEGKFSVFLDVTSAHKNEGGYTDVLPLSTRADVTIKEKVASVIIKINSINLRNKDEIKFTPDEARYGLLFDATSSTPTSGAKFTNTKWDFGNGEVREYAGDPRVERVVYGKEGEFTVKLTLKTNELKQIERKFVVNIHDPIATINASSEEGFLGDKFTFSAQNNTNDKDLSFSWEIIDLNKDTVIFRKSGTLFTYTFNEKGKYNVKMNVTDPSGETDTDSKIIYINSRAPVADFITSIPFSNKPNRVFFDATKSFDPDYSDDGKLKYIWTINGDRVELEEANFNGSTGYFTFDSVGEHSVVLEVEDPDGIKAAKKDKVKVSSILSVEFFAFPRVAQRNNTVRFVTESPEARFYEWDFGDGDTIGGKDGNVSHKFEKSGTFKVRLKVIDANDKENTFSKNVYIGESDSPYAFISVMDSTRNDIAFDEQACGGKGAYIANRVDSITFSGKESINITGENRGLTYSWKVGNEAYKNSQEFSKKFDELGCFPIKLTVKSDDNGRTHSTETYVVVKNIKPDLSSIDVKIVDDTSDPVIVNISALGARDRDGVIQSYLWYYYTDIDSEPQDFRATKSPSTSFVLPKVTGNYYFVVVMKDNNEERITSEEITGAKYFMTLTGDNLNTPLVKLSIDDSSVAIGEEAIFTANVENILGQDLTKKVKYSWDFDGDGFYDKETSSNIATYKYTSSGEKHAKVKVKYKGFSNTKSVTVNVSNILQPNFGYISIGNKIIFFDSSIGSLNSLEWNLGDGTLIKNQDYFVHEYTDNKTSHLVTLKISEGTKVKEIKKKVIKNVKNIIKSRKDGLVVFSYPSINNEDEIVLENSTDNVYIYLGESNGDIENYVIDYDIEYDSDLNGGNDDDEDNYKQNSYSSGSVMKVKLNDKKYQKIRLYIKDSDGSVIESKDVIIVKNYIEEELIDIDSIVFEGVSDNIKLKIEELKELISLLPKEHKLKGMMYVQKLQEEWSDNREKTQVILEFESFIYETGVDNSNEIVDLLESLLVEDQEDKSEKAITYNALKNLLPESIVCKNSETGESSACYNDLVSKLETIRDNDNIDENKVLGTDILNAVLEDQVMTNKEKNDFKAILKTLVYGGIANIPEEDVTQVVEEEQQQGGEGIFVSLLINVFKWIFYILLGFSGIVFIYYIYYLLVNKDKNIGFQDFIIEKTSGVKKVKKPKENIVRKEDVLNNIKEESVKKQEEKVEEVIEQKPELKKEEVPDWLKGNLTEEEKGEGEENVLEGVKEETKEVKEEKIEEQEVKQESVPDWLKGSFTEEEKIEGEKISEIKEEEKEVKEEKIEEEQEVKQENVPDWLKGSFTEEEKTKSEKVPEVKKEEEKEVEEVEEEQEVKQEENIPDWLKGSFAEEKEDVKDETEKTKTKGKTVKEETKAEIVSDQDIEEATKVQEENVPDWLKGDLESSKEEKTEKKSEENVPDWLKGSFTEEEKEPEKKTKEVKEEKIEKKEEETKTISKKPTRKKKSKKQVTKSKESQKSDEEKIKTDQKETKTSKQEQVGGELWDDGMKIPDWLKTDSDDANNSK